MRAFFAAVCAMALLAVPGECKKRKKFKMVVPDECSVCKAVMGEIDQRIAKVDPKKLIRTGSFTVSPSGDLDKVKTAKYARSESHLSEILDDLCEKTFKDYQDVEGKPGMIEFQNGSSAKLGNNNAMKNQMGLKTSEEGVQKGKALECSRVVEDNEDSIIGHFHEGGNKDDGIEELCPKFCKETKVKIPKKEKKKKGKAKEETKKEETEEEKTAREAEETKKEDEAEAKRRKEDDERHEKVMKLEHELSVKQEELSAAEHSLSELSAGAEEHEEPGLVAKEAKAKAQAAVDAARDAVDDKQREVDRAMEPPMDDEDKPDPVAERLREIENAKRDKEEAKWRAIEKKREAAREKAKKRADKKKAKKAKKAKKSNKAKAGETKPAVAEDDEDDEDEGPEPPYPLECYIEEDIDYADHDIEMTVAKHGPACATKCLAFTSGNGTPCTHFTYTETGHCYLKMSDAGRRQAYGVTTSGRCKRKAPVAPPQPEQDDDAVDDPVEWEKDEL